MVRVVTRGVAAVDVAGGDRCLRPGQGVEGGEQPGLVLPDGKAEPGADRAQVLGMGALRLQGVCGDHRVGQVDTGGGELWPGRCHDRYGRDHIRSPSPTTTRLPTRTDRSIPKRLTASSGPRLS